MIKFVYCQAKPPNFFTDFLVPCFKKVGLVTLIMQQVLNTQVWPYLKRLSTCYCYCLLLTSVLRGIFLFETKTF